VDGGARSCMGGSGGHSRSSRSPPREARTRVRILGALPLVHKAGAVAKGTGVAHGCGVPLEWGPVCVDP
jgi:hypothetical protein